MVFCARGTCSSGISSPRSPRATMTASDAARISSRWASASGRSSLATMRNIAGAGFAGQPTRLSDVVRGLDEAERDHVDAERAPEPQVFRVLRRNRGSGQTHAGSVDALVLAKLTALDDGGLNPLAVRAVDAELDQTIGKQQPIARLDAGGEPFEGRVEMRPGPPMPSPVSIVSRSPALTVIGRPPSSFPVRIFGRRDPEESPPRDPTAPPRHGRANRFRDATRTCRARSSTGRYRRRRR